MKTSVLPEHVRITMERAIAEQMDIVERMCHGSNLTQAELMTFVLLPHPIARQYKDLALTMEMYMEMMKKNIIRRAKKEAKEGRWD